MAEPSHYLLLCLCTTSCLHVLSSDCLDVRKEHLHGCLRRPSVCNLMDREMTVMMCDLHAA